MDLEKLIEERDKVAEEIDAIFAKANKGSRGLNSTERER